jgi:CBS domain-containing protein
VRVVARGGACVRIDRSHEVCPLLPANMPRFPHAEMIDPRKYTDPAWGGVHGTRADVAENNPDEFGEEPWERFGDATQQDPGERYHGHRWRSRPMRASDLMTADPRRVGPNASLKAIATIMLDEDCGIVPVVDEGRLVGVVTDRDLVCRVVAHNLDQSSARARDVMSEDIASVDEQASLDDVLREMERHQVRRICVVREDDSLAGIISMADLAREADVDYELQDAFLDISSDRSFWERLR